MCVLVWVEMCLMLFWPRSLRIEGAFCVVLSTVGCVALVVYCARWVAVGGNGEERALLYRTMGWNTL